MSDLRGFRFWFQRESLTTGNMFILFPGVDFSPGLLVSKRFVCLICVFPAFGFKGNLSTGNMFIFFQGLIFPLVCWCQRDLYV